MLFYPINHVILDKTEENKLYIQKPEVEFLTFGFACFFSIKPYLCVRL